MTREEAIEAIKCNWPDSRYTILREALDMAISALREQEGKDTNAPTNAGRIRDMSDEELAKFLAVTAGDKIGGMAKFWLEWLQQTAEDDDHA